MVRLLIWLAVLLVATSALRLRGTSKHAVISRVRVAAGLTEQRSTRMGLSSNSTERQALDFSLTSFERQALGLGATSAELEDALLGAPKNQKRPSKYAADPITLRALVPNTPTGYTCNPARTLCFAAVTQKNTASKALEVCRDGVKDAKGDLVQAPEARVCSYVELMELCGQGLQPFALEKQEYQWTGDYAGTASTKGIGHFGRVQGKGTTTWWGEDNPCLLGAKIDSSSEARASGSHAFTCCRGGTNPLDPGYLVYALTYAGDKGEKRTAALKTMQEPEKAVTYVPLCSNEYGVDDAPGCRKSAEQAVIPTFLAKQPFAGLYGDDATVTISQTVCGAEVAGVMQVADVLRTVRSADVCASHTKSGRSLKQAINECAGLKAHICTYAELAQLSGDKQRNPCQCQRFREPRDPISTEFWYGDHGTMGKDPYGTGGHDGDWDNEFLTYQGTTSTVSPQAIPEAKAVVDWSAKDKDSFFLDDKNREFRCCNSALNYGRGWCPTGFVQADKQALCFRDPKWDDNHGRADYLYVGPKASASDFPSAHCPAGYECSGCIGLGDDGMILKEDGTEVDAYEFGYGVKCTDKAGKDLEIYDSAECVKTVDNTWWTGLFDGKSEAGPEVSVRFKHKTGSTGAFGEGDGPQCVDSKGGTVTLSKHDKAECVKTSGNTWKTAEERTWEKTWGHDMHVLCRVRKVKATAYEAVEECQDMGAHVCTFNEMQQLCGSGINPYYGDGLGWYGDHARTLDGDWQGEFGTWNKEHGCNSGDNDGSAKESDSAAMAYRCCTKAGFAPKQEVRLEPEPGFCTTKVKRVTLVSHTYSGASTKSACIKDSTGKEVSVSPRTEAECEKTSGNTWRPAKRAELDFSINIPTLKGVTQRGSTGVKILPMEHGKQKIKVICKDDKGKEVAVSKETDCKAPLKVTNTPDTRVQWVTWTLSEEVEVSTLTFETDAEGIAKGTRLLLDGEHVASFDSKGSRCVDTKGIEVATAYVKACLDPKGNKITPTSGSECKNPNNWERVADEKTCKDKGHTWYAESHFENTNLVVTPCVLGGVVRPALANYNVNGGTDFLIISPTEAAVAAGFCSQEGDILQAAEGCGPVCSNPKEGKRAIWASEFNDDTQKDKLLTGTACVDINGKNLNHGLTKDKLLYKSAFECLTKDEFNRWNPWWFHINGTEECEACPAANWPGCPISKGDQDYFTCRDEDKGRIPSYCKDPEQRLDDLLYVLGKDKSEGGLVENDPRKEKRRKRYSDAPGVTVRQECHGIQEIFHNPFGVGEAIHKTQTKWAKSMGTGPVKKSAGLGETWFLPDPPFDPNRLLPKAGAMCGIFGCHEGLIGFLITLVMNIVMAGISQWNPITGETTEGDPNCQFKSIIDGMSALWDFIKFKISKNNNPYEPLNGATRATHFEHNARRNARHDMTNTQDGTPSFMEVGANGEARVRSVSSLSSRIDGGGNQWAADLMTMIEAGIEQAVRDIVDAFADILDKESGGSSLLEEDKHEATREAKRRGLVQELGMSEYEMEQVAYIAHVLNASTEEELHAKVDALFPPEMLEVGREFEEGREERRARRAKLRAIAHSSLLEIDDNIDREFVELDEDDDDEKEDGLSGEEKELARALAQLEGGEFDRALLELDEEEFDEEGDIELAHVVRRKLAAFRNDGKEAAGADDAEVEDLDDNDEEEDEDLLSLLSDDVENIDGVLSKYDETAATDSSYESIASLLEAEAGVDKHTLAIASLLEAEAGVHKHTPGMKFRDTKLSKPIDVGKAFKAKAGSFEARQAAVTKEAPKFAFDKKKFTIAKGKLMSKVKVELAKKGAGGYRKGAFTISKSKKLKLNTKYLKLKAKAIKWKNKQIGLKGGQRWALDAHVEFGALKKGGKKKGFLTKIFGLFQPVFNVQRPKTCQSSKYKSTHKTIFQITNQQINTQNPLVHSVQRIIRASSCELM